MASDNNTRVTYLAHNDSPDENCKYLRIDDQLSDDKTFRGWDFYGRFVAYPRADYREVARPGWLKSPEPKKEHWRSLLPVLHREKERLGFEPAWLQVCREWIEDRVGEGDGLTE